jgi:hypothetical protein
MPEGAIVKCTDGRTAIFDVGVNVTAVNNELMSIVVFARRGLIRRQAVAEPVCCRSPVVRL